MKPFNIILHTYWILAGNCFCFHPAKTHPAVHPVDPPFRLDVASEAVGYVPSPGNPHLKSLFYE